MKNSTLQKVVSLACALPICFIANNVTAIESSPETNNDYLSVRESLLPMVSFAYRFNEFFPLHRINPGVKPYILFYLEKDNSNHDLIAGGIWLLGFVGQEEDVQFIDRYIQSFLRSPDYKHRHPTTLVGSAGNFAGSMMKRDIKGAKQFFVKYANVDAWMPPKESPEIVNAARRDYSYFIMGAYHYSKADFILPLLRQKSSGPRPFSHESALDAFEKLEVDEYTRLMKPDPTPEETLKKYRMDFLSKSGGQWADMLLKKQTSAQWRQAHQEKQKTVSRAEKRTIDSFETIDMGETVEAGYLKAIGSEAANAYVWVSRMLLDRDTKNSPIKKEILRDIQKAGLNKYEGFRVRIDVGAKIKDFVPVNKGAESKASVPIVVKEKETADVTFNIRDTADIFKKHVPDAGDNSLISSTTGDVKINMKRINRKWKWNSASNSSVSSMADIVEDNYLIDSVNEAMTAYIQITSIIIDGNYDPLEIPVLDNNKLIPLEKRKRTKDELVEALDFEKKILQDILQANLKDYGDFRIKLEFEATLGNFVPAVNGIRGNKAIEAEVGTRPVEVKGYETATGTLVIRDAAKIYKKHASPKMDTYSIDRAGNLHVYMKRINGRWYWNPFGW